MKALSVASRSFLIASLVGVFGLQASAENRGGAFRRGGFAGRVPGSPTGFGNIIFPGTGVAPPAATFGRFPVSPFFTPNSSFADRLGATISGSPGYTGAPIGRFRNGGGAIVVPYPYPVFAGGYGYDSSGYGQQPNTVIVLPQSPPVTINQGYTPETARPVIREYGPTSSAQPEEESNVHVYQAPSPERAAQASEDQVLFLIALKDSSVYSAVAYWVQGETLHYITPQGKHNQVSLSLVDRRVTEKLNRGRQVEFKLPQ